MTSPEKLAQLKETENIIRFEIRCLFLGVEPTDVMLSRVKQYALRFYRENPTKTDMPASMLIDIAKGIRPYEEANA